MPKVIRDPARAYTITDLMAATGWSRPTVIATMKCGFLPGYQSGPGGKWVCPAEAFRALCAGTWKPQPREVAITLGNVEM